jgi:predicted membrane chloride channel (bestrophin family)
MGRLSFGKAVLYTRDAASLIVTMIYPKNPKLALKLLRHVALYGWLLKGFLRGPEVNGDDQDIIRTMLRDNHEDIDYVLAQRKSPMAVVMRLRQVVQYLSDRHVINTAEELALDHTTQELNHCLTTTERIRASPIPPLYTSHTGRLLMFYLFFLPLALCGSGTLDGLTTVLTTTATAYAMLGLDEISFLLEQPFRLMPLFQLSKNSMTDVADTAVIRPPPIPCVGLDGSIEGVSPSATAPESKKYKARPTYW